MGCKNTILGKKRIRLYGMGIYGIRAYYMLKARGIVIDCFIDQNAAHYSRGIEGSKCISVEQALKENNRNIVTVVCLKEVDEVASNLEKMGFCNVYCVNQIIDELKDIPLKENYIIKEEENVQMLYELVQEAYFNEISSQSGLNNEFIKDIQEGYQH